MSRTKRIFFATVAVALFFGLLEVSLWAAGVDTLLGRRDPFEGFSRQVRVFEPDPARGVLATPPRALAHSFNYQQFAIDKPAGGFRVFVLGGSSAFGFPWGAEAAFPRLVGDALRAAWPDRDVEVVNAAAMSYGSHRLRILIHEVLEYAPDLVVVYGGHNEFVERRFYRDHLDRRETLDRARRTLYRSRTYSLMAQLYESAAAPAAGEPGGDLLGLDVDREYATEVGAAEKAEVRALFEENLRAIVGVARAAGVPVLLCTVPSNVAGWVPNDSFFTADAELEARARVTALLAEGRAALERRDAVAAESALTEARELAPGHAEGRFRLGQAYRALGRDAAAREEFVAARDADGKPSRAPSALLESIRHVARTEDVPLVDVERLFEQHAPRGLLGFNLFEDYVHPNLSGHRLIAWAVWSAILNGGLGGRPSAPDVDVFRAAVGDPFAIGADAARPPAATGARTPNLLYNLAVVLENQGLLDQAVAKYRECLALNPEYWLARENLARALFQQQRFGEAAVEYGVVAQQRPDRVEPLIGLGETLRRAGRVDLALQALERATALEPESAQAWNSLGGTLAQLNRQADAEAAFLRAVELAGDDPENWVNLGLSLLFQKRLVEARAAFDTALERQPHHPRARNGIAAVLTEQGELDEAERLFRENLALDPDDAFARGGLDTIRRRRDGS